MSTSLRIRDINFDIGRLNFVFLLIWIIDINQFGLNYTIYMGFALNIICIDFFSLFGFVVLASSFYCSLSFFFFGFAWLHNGSPKVKMGAVELVATGHGHGRYVAVGTADDGNS